MSEAISTADQWPRPHSRVCAHCREEVQAGGLRGTSGVAVRLDVSLWQRPRSPSRQEAQGGAGPCRSPRAGSPHRPEFPCRVTTERRELLLQLQEVTLCCVTSGEGPADLRVLTFPRGQGQPWASQALLRDHMVLIQMQNFWKEMSFKL